MRLAVVGFGAIGALSAVIAAGRGHEVGVWCPRGAPGHGRAEGEGWRVICRGALEGEATVVLLAGVEALAGWENVLLAVPGDAYPGVLPGLVEALGDGHRVFCGGALSLLPLLVAERAAAGGRRPGVAAWGTTLGTGRIVEGPMQMGVVQVGTVRKRFEMAALPGERLGEMAGVAAALFGDRFAPVESVLVPTLSNINPVAHAGQVIPNLSRIERGEAWQLFGCFGRTGAAIAGAIDAGRVAIAAAFGLEVRSLARHYHLSYHVPEGPIEAIAAAIEAGGRGPLGPSTFEHRYIREDMPFGLAVYERLARVAGVATPALSAALDMLGVAVGRELRGMNPLLPMLGLDGETVGSLRARCSA